MNDIKTKTLISKIKSSRVAIRKKLERIIRVLNDKYDAAQFNFY